ncbi:hypothetical protein, partial [Porcincola intestinalis]|uniref:hypothetical protein n=1 Tax=Porcincola intestinalis TaxID=2606632 RepID=UPI002A8372EF
FTFSIGSILLFLDIEIPPSRFYISLSYLGVAYQEQSAPVFFEAIRASLSAGHEMTAEPQN